MRIPKDIRRLIILSPGKLPPGLGERLLLLRIRNATANNRHSSLLFAESEQHQPRNKSIFRVCLCSALHLSRLDKTVVTVTVHTNGNIIGCWRNENVNLNQSSFARSTFTFPELRIYPPTKSACAFFAGTQHTRRCEVNALLFLLLLQRRYLPTFVLLLLLLLLLRSVSCRYGICTNLFSCLCPATAAAAGDQHFPKVSHLKMQISLRPDHFFATPLRRYLMKSLIVSNKICIPDR